MTVKIGTRRTGGEFGGGRSGGPKNPSDSRRSGVFCSMLSQQAMILLLALAALGAVQTSSLYGQARPAGEQRMGFGAIATINGANSQLPYYADNALGYSFGSFLQLTPLLGIEGRISSYPMSATFHQSPFTAGVRVAPTQTREVQLLPYFYFGGGYSHSQYSKADYQPSVPLWAPCWQAISGTDLGFSKFRWRVYEVNWNETFALRQNIRTIGVSTGVVYTFRQ
jgi:hypothetical protein